MSLFIRARVPALIECGKITLLQGRRGKSPVIYLISKSVSSSSNKEANSSMSVASGEKTEFEIEYENVVKKGKHQRFYGFYEDEPMLDKIMFHGLMFGVFTIAIGFSVVMAFYFPDFLNRKHAWKKREAYIQIAERTRKGLPLINKDFAPVEMMESMVPPPGDWEIDWLRKQPTTKPSKAQWTTQDFTI